MTFSTTLGKMVLYGGRYFDGGQWEYYESTWAFDGTDWSELTPALPRPSARKDAVLVSDGGAILFGGYDGSGSDAPVFVSTPVFDGATISEIEEVKAANRARAKNTVAKIVPPGFICLLNRPGK